MSKNTPHVNTEADRPWKLSLSIKTLIQGKITHERKKETECQQTPTSSLYFYLQFRPFISKCDGKVQTLNQGKGEEHQSSKSL